MTAWPTREIYADGMSTHVGAGHARPCTSPQTHGTGKTAFLAPSGRGLPPQRVGERTSRLSEIFRAMARFSPSGHAGPPPSQREAGGERFPANARYRETRGPDISGPHCAFLNKIHRQHRIIPALRLKHRSGGCGTASALPKCSIIHKVLSALLA